MIYIVINAVAIVVGCAIGALFRKSISEKCINVLNTALGLCAFTLGIQMAIDNMQKTEYSVLFICFMSVGGLLGTALKLDQRMESATRRISTSNLTEGITTGILLCCVGSLAIMGPVNAALYNDGAFLMAAAMLNFVTMIVLASSYGFGTVVTALVVFVWMSSIYGIALLSRDVISDALTVEMSLVGGIMIAASGLGILHIKDCKTVNLLPALFMPMAFFALRALYLNLVDKL